MHDLEPWRRLVLQALGHAGRAAASRSQDYAFGDIRAARDLLVRADRAIIAAWDERAARGRAERLARRRGR